MTSEIPNSSVFTYLKAITSFDLKDKLTCISNTGCYNKKWWSACLRTPGSLCTSQQAK